MVERCVREHIALRAGEIRLTVKPLYNSRFIGEAVFRSCPKKRQRPHKIPQTRIFRESYGEKKIKYRGVAQFGRALRSGRRGRRFESCRLDQFLDRK